MRKPQYKLQNKLKYKLQKKNFFENSGSINTVNKTSIGSEY